MRERLREELMTAAVLAVFAGAFYAWRKGRKKVERDKREDSCAGSGMTEAKLKEYLCRLFKLYADGRCARKENTESCWWERDAGYFAELLYPYVRENMKTVLKMEGADGCEDDDFGCIEKLFGHPACQIYREPIQSFYFNIDLSWEMELWMLEDGQFAVVNFIAANEGGRKVTCRLLDRYVREYRDIPFAVEDLKTGLALLAKEGKRQGSF